jgi:hypothetical protein
MANALVVGALQFCQSKPHDKSLTHQLMCVCGMGRNLLSDNTLHQLEAEVSRIMVNSAGIVKANSSVLTKAQFNGIFATSRRHAHRIVKHYTELWGKAVAYAGALQVNCALCAAA